MQNLSTKELNYELLSAKKCFQYSNQETNPSHQKVFSDAANLHQQNYQSLLNYINQINNKQGGQTH